VLKSIHIRNLRGVRECLITDLADVNVLIGRNGAGKSTVLEALYIASHWANGRDSIRELDKVEYVLTRRCGRGRWRNLRDALWFEKVFEREIEIVLQFNSGAGLRFKLLHDYPPLYREEEHVWLEVTPDIVPEVATFGRLYFNLLRGDFLNPITKSYEGRVPPIARDRLLSRFGNEIEFLRDVILIDGGLSVQDVESRVWPKLFDWRLDELAANMVREEYEPEARDFIYKPLKDGPYVLALRLPRTTLELDALGDGARMAVLISSALALVKSTAALIEDPEVHQHPGGLATLTRFVMRMAKERKLQLFITTHSVEFVGIAKKVCEDLGLRLKAFFMERDPSGMVDVRSLESFDVEVLQRLGLDPRLLHVL